VGLALTAAQSRRRAPGVNARVTTGDAPGFPVDPPPPPEIDA